MAVDTDTVVRIEKDTLGEMEVPAGALYGAQTARAVENFPVSGWRMPGEFLVALARIKEAFARANAEFGLLGREEAEAIAAAASEVAAGGHLEQFPVDVFQTGSGTSTNMNMNEVLAHIANRALGGDPASNRPVHPNDHVNKGQSSNDVIPAALRVAAVSQWRAVVRPALHTLAAELRRLGADHQRTVTLARTHLMDAVPTTYGRVFDAWARGVADAWAAPDRAADSLLALPLGGTAVGSGIGADPRAVDAAVRRLRDLCGLDVRALENPSEGIQAQDAPIAYGDALAALARCLLAVADDVRLRSSGPFGGLGELKLPAVQPGSSIMPGKVNPVIAEAVMQVALEVEGLTAACRASVVLHQLDLSLANPLLAWNLYTCGRLLANAAEIFVTRCLEGLKVDTDRARGHAEASPAMATALAGRLGYERAAEVAKAAESAGETVAATARRMGVLPEEELARVLDLERLAGIR
jgi:fumarate hydratase class II